MPAAAPDPACTAALAQNGPRSPISAEALAVHAAATPVDLHADTPKFMARGYDIHRRHEPPIGVRRIGGHVDVPRMQEGNLRGQFFGMWTFPKPEAGCYAEVHRQLDALDRAAADPHGRLRRCTSADDILAARAAGHVAALAGIEGAQCLGRGPAAPVLERLASFARRGVRYLGLLHFSRNALGYPEKGWGQDASRGLTPLGAEVVDACARHGMLVDLAHINRRGFFEVAARRPGPLLVSHTGVAGVNPHWRNIDDEQLRAVADSGGVVGVIFAPRFLGQDGLDGVVAHLRHIIAVAGPDTVAIGSDWDGFVLPTRGLRSPAELPNLTEALLRAGVPADVVHKLLGDNVLRVLRAQPLRPLQ